MALIDIEGFDHFAIADFGKKWQCTNTQGKSLVTGRLGGQALRQTNNGGNGSNPVKLLPSTYTEVYLGFAWRIVTAVNSNFAYRVTTSDGSTAVMTIQPISSGGGYVLRLLNAAGGTIATGTRVLALGSWYYLEAHVKVNGASGVAALKIDGVTEIADTTANLGSTNIGGVLLTVTNANSDTDIDDMYWVDTTGASRNTYLGDQRVESLWATADGAVQQWASSSGTAHNDIDETTANGDTDYLSDSTPGDRSTFAFGDLSVSTGTVNGVRINHFARKDEAAVRQIASVIRQSAVNYDGATLPAMSTTYAVVGDVYDKDPTGTDWTISTVNGNEYGVKEVA